MVLFSIPAKRILVMILSVAIIIVGIGSVSMYADIIELVLAILCIVGGFYGLVGAWYMHPGHLGFFLITLLVLATLQAIFIIYSLLHYGHWFSNLVWNIATLALLIVGAAFTADLRRAVMGYDSIADPLMTGTAPAGPLV